MEAKIYNKEGEESGKVKLSEDFFGASWNADLVHQAVTTIQANDRQNGAYARARGQVSGGGKKPWRQKGTGRARHGSSRSPLWVGGGVTHGPTKERDYSKKLSKKMRAKALSVILSKKLRDGGLVFVDTFGLSEPKTKSAQNSLSALSKISGLQKITYKKGKRTLVITPALDEGTLKSFRNIPSAKVSEARDVSVLDLVTFGAILITEPEKSVEEFLKRSVKTSEKSGKIKKKVTRTNKEGIKQAS